MQAHQTHETFKYKLGTYQIPELRMGDLVLLNREISVFNENPFPRDRIIVGIMGSAGNETDRSGNEFKPTQEQKDLGEYIGQIIAKRNCIVSNGAAWGLPYFPVRGANRIGGYTMGISPYSNEREHREKNPLKHLDLVFYTGIDYKDEPHFKFIFRDSMNVLYPDVVISLEGRWGTLNEDSASIELGRVFVPVLTGGEEGATGLIKEAIEDERIKKDTGAEFFIPDGSPGSLEQALNNAVDEVERRWQAEGRTQNRFSPVIDELERIMQST